MLINLISHRLNINLPMSFSSLRALFATAGLALLMAAPVLAQAPGNDRCSQATLVANGSFAVAQTINANDDIPGLTGCQGTNVPHPDVWFVHAPTTSRFSIIVTPDQGVTAPYEILVFSGACGTSLLGINDKCVPGGQDSLVVGAGANQPYYIVIASPSASQTGTFLVNIQSRGTVVVPAQDCMNANVVPTGTAPIVQGPFNLGFGTVVDEVTTTNSCFGNQTDPSGNDEITDERQPKWYKFIAGTPGKLNFNIRVAIG